MCVDYTVRSTQCASLAKERESWVDKWQLCTAQTTRTMSSFSSSSETKVAKQIWKDFLLEKNVEEPSEKRDLALILKSFYVDARKKDGSSYSLGSLKTLRFALNWHFKAVQSFDILNDAEFSDGNKAFAAKWAPKWFRVIWAIEWFQVMWPLGEFALVLHFTQ